MKLQWKLFAIVVLFGSVTATLLPQSLRPDPAGIALERARKMEVIDGNPEGAIKLYQEVVARYGTQRAVLADALVGMARSYQKIGDPEARKLYARVLQDYPDQRNAAALAAARLASLGTTTANDVSPQSVLKPKSTGPFSIPVNLEARAAYDMLADRAGVNAVFYPGFVPETPVTLRVANLDIFAALDAVSAQTGNFWFAWDAKTIVIGTDTAQTRRDIDPKVVKTIYVDKATSAETFRAVMNNLRVKLQLRNVYGSDTANALVIQDTPSNMSRAEALIAELTGMPLPLPSSGTLRVTENPTVPLLVPENGIVRKVASPGKASLENTLKGGVSVDANEPARAVYERIALQAGLNVIFDSPMRDTLSRFRLQNAELIDALDLLALQTATMWQPLNDSTIWVGQATPQNRRDFEAVSVKVLYLSSKATTADLNAILNVLRTAIQLRGIFQNEKSKAILIRDTPNNIYVAEKVIADLDKGGDRPVPVAIKTTTSSLQSEGGWRLGSAAAARSSLELTLKNRTTIRLNETPRASFEAVGKLAGLRVVFDSRFPATGPQTPFNVYGIDVLDALDLLSFQTHSFWQVVDPKTIRVIPDTQATRKELIPVIVKSFVPADNGAESVNGIANCLRTVLAMRDVSVVRIDEKYQITITDNADNLAVAEQVIAALGGHRD